MGTGCGGRASEPAHACAPCATQLTQLLSRGSCKQCCTAMQQQAAQPCNTRGCCGLAAAHLTVKAAAAGRAARCLMASCEPQKAAGGVGRAGGGSVRCWGGRGAVPAGPTSRPPNARRPWHPPGRACTLLKAEAMAGCCCSGAGLCVLARRLERQAAVQSTTKRAAERAGGAGGRR